MSTGIAFRGAAAARRVGAQVRPQALVSGGQLAAGAGNLAFTLVAARLLLPRDFAAVALFLALYLVLHVPVNALSAAGALSPADIPRRRRALLLAGGALGVALALAAPALVALLDSGVLPVLGVAASAPAAGLLALERGRLYGGRRYAGAVASLLAEPATRLTAGVLLGAAFGAPGVVVAVVAGGYLALAAARRAARGVEAPAPATKPAPAARAGWTVAVLALCALFQNLDLLLSRNVLPPDEVAAFAALSTLGGAAAFATATIPVVLLPRAAAREPGALAAAVLAAAGLGGTCALAVALQPQLAVNVVFGGSYGAIAPLAGHYVGALALFGAARVLLSRLCAAGRERAAAVLAAGAVALHAAVVLGTARDLSSLAGATLLSSSVLLAGSVASSVVELGTRPLGFEELWRRIRRSPVWHGAGLALAVGLVLRLLVTRGLWLDEATSVFQARMGFAEMLDNLRYTDVHPPLHYVVLWAAVHLFGSSEIVAKLPSVVAGTLVIPAVFVLARELYGDRTARIAAVFAAISPFIVWYSQEARMYALYMLFAVLAVLGQVRALRGGSVRDWGLYALAAAATVWTHYMGVLQLGAQQLVFAGALWSHRRSRTDTAALLRGWLAASTVVGLLCAPLVPFATDQYLANEAAGKGFSQQVPSQAGTAVAGGGPGVYSALANVIWAVWGYHADSTMEQIAALWPLGMLGGLLLLGRGRSRPTTVVLTLAGVPLAALVVLGVFKPNLFEIRYAASVVPLLVVLMARAVDGWLDSHRTRVVVAAFLALTMCAGLADQQLNGANPRLYDFKGALAEVSRRADRDDLLVYEPEILKHLVAYYAPGVEARALGDELPRARAGRRVFLLASFLEKRDVRSRLQRALPRLRERERGAGVIDRPNVRVWIFR